MDLNAAAEQVRQMAARYEGMVVAADALAKIGSLENAIKEANARLRDTLLRNNQADADRLLLEKRNDELKLRFETEHSAKVVNAEKALEVMAAECALMLSTAHAGAAEARAKALEEVEEIKAGHAAIEESAGKRIAGLMEGLAELERDIADKSAELAEVEAKLAKAREAMAKLMAA